MLTPWMCSPPSHQPLPRIPSVHISRWLLEKSGSSSLSIQTSSLPMVSQPPLVAWCFPRPHYGPWSSSLFQGPPPGSRQTCLCPAKFLKMEKAGIVRRSFSPWSSPLHMVPKPDGTWRPCGDFHCLNTATVPDRNPLPAVSDFYARISRSKFFQNLIFRRDISRFP